MLVRREVGPTTLLLSGKCPSMLYQLFSHSAAAGVPLAVQLPTVVLLGCQQMEHSAVIGAGCGGCQKPYTAWHMQIDPRHLVVPCSGHVKKNIYSEKAIGEGEPLVGARVSLCRRCRAVPDSGGQPGQGISPSSGCRVAQNAWPGSGMAVKCHQGREQGVVTRAAAVLLLLGEAGMERDT